MKDDICILLSLVLKASTDVDSLVMAGRRFHSTVVLGKKENFRQSFFEVW